ncbi:MAG: hypothetical protein K2L13_04075 [Opitutales bacterium]|nr:hypothetical protein [Opitutales bacterium]
MEMEVRVKDGVFKYDQQIEQVNIAQEKVENAKKFFAENLQDLVITKNELSLRSCLESAHSGSEKFINFFKWIGNIVCYYIGGVNLKKALKGDSFKMEGNSQTIQQFLGFIAFPDVKIPLFRIKNFMELLQDMPNRADKIGDNENTNPAQPLQIDQGS